MPTGLDHIVIAVNDLDEAISDFTALGFTVTPGGEHKGGLSHNALITFQDGTYFEIIAFRDGGNGHGTHWPQLLRTGEGLVDYALRTNDLAKEVVDLHARGIAYTDPQDGGRFRPDGQRVDWQTARFSEEEPPTPFPFYCHDITARNLRVPDGDAAIHANGITGVAGIRVVVTTIAAVQDRFAALTGNTGTAIANGSDDVAVARQYPLEDGQWIALIEPTAETSPLRTYLEQRGPVPYEVVLIAPNGTNQVLDTGKTHGARLIVAAG